MAKRRKVGNLLALSLLSLLAQQPMYPYEMAQTLRARGKEQNFKINWGSLYTVVANLEKYGFIERVRHRARGPPARAHHLPDHRAGAGGAAGLAERAAQRARGRARRLRHRAVRGGHPAARRGNRPAHHAARHAGQGQRQPAGRPHAVGRAPAQGAARRGRVPARHARRPGRLAARAIGEIVEGTISGVDAWRRMHETGEVPAEFEELDELAKRGWDRSRARTARTATRTAKNDPGPRCCNTANRGRNLTNQSRAGTGRRRGPIIDCMPGDSARG